MVRFVQLLFVIIAVFAPRPIQGVIHVPVEDCPPTISPGPTESPAPSPSPSNPPTDTSGPSGSLVPSVSPTDNPTTTAPSHPPTAAPTESPAPSPSPSRTPTDSPSSSPSVSNKPTTTERPSNVPSVSPTNAPSRSPSQFPSRSPSAFPTPAPTATTRPTGFPSDQPTNLPSSGPTSHPTDTPSVVPSDIPSDVPTFSPTTPRPSTDPSASPTTSLQPSVSTVPSSQPSVSPAPTRSMMPSEKPSGSPSASPSASSRPSAVPSDAPTSMPSFTLAPTAIEVFFSASGTTITFKGVDGKMNPRKVTIFEKQTLEFLNKQIQVTPGISKIRFLHVKNTHQSLNTSRKLSSITELDKEYTLTIKFDVEAMVVLGGTTAFDLSILLDMFFANAGNVRLLRDILEASAVFLQDVIIPIQNDSGKPKNNPVQSSSFSVSIVGALVGIIFSVAGSAFLFVWIRNRKSFAQQPSLEPAYFSSRDIEDQYEYSYSYGESCAEESDPPTPRVIIDQSSVDGTERSQYPQEHTIYPVESIETSLMMPSASAYYRPALIPMESNIEIPDTPRTNYEPSNYEPSNYETSQFSPKDIQMSEFDLDTHFPDVAKKSEIYAGEQKMKSKQKTTSFFSPGLLGTRRKDKDENETKKRNGADHHSKRSGRSPVRNDRLRNDIRKHDIRTDAEFQTEVIRDETNSTQENYVRDSQETSIGVMDEVAYLYSTDKKGQSKSWKLASPS